MLSSVRIDVYQEGVKMAVLAYVLITMQAGSEKDVLKRVSNFKEIVEANLVVGEYDAVVKVKVEDISELDKFLTDKLRALPDIFLTTTVIITKEFK
jgi:DNA-binding Lrp family transcriptional regulator